MLIRKTFTVERKTIDAEAGIYEAMISTEETDRDGDIIRAAGVDLANFLRNPVVLAGHNYRELDAVIGKALEVTPMPGKGIRAKFQFAPADVNPKADVVRRLWDSEFLNATSIGFIPKEAKPLEGNQRGYDFLKWELLEFSIVGIPSNQSALAIRTLEGLESRYADDDETARINAQALELLKEHLNIEAKRGRVLSAANEQKIKDARDNLNEVLSQLDEQPTEDAGKEVSADIAKAALPVHHTATSDGAWDGPANEARLANDAGAATFKKFFAWIDPEADPDTKAAYKFGHHEVSGEGSVGAANIKACITGIAVLNGGRGGTTIPDADNEGVWKHLAAHISDAGNEPPPLKTIDENSLETDSKNLDGRDQKEVEPPSLPASAAAQMQIASDLSVELRQMLDAVGAMYASPHSA